MTLYVDNNGELAPAGGLNIDMDNRAFKYGDGLFESIRIVNSKPVGLGVHMDRLKMGMEQLKINIPDSYNETYFRERLQTLINKNGVDGGGRARLTIYRSNGGFYRPLNNDPMYALEVFPVDDNLFALNNVGLKVDLYPDIRKKNSKLSQFKSSNALLYVMAALYAQEHDLDDVILQNDKFEIIEGTSSNLFIVSNGVLYTPGLDSGCVGGTMRMQLINLAIKNNIRVYESNIAPSNLLVADEVFFSNAISGIRWVASYKTKRYFNSVSQKLVDLLNQQYAT